MSWEDILKNIKDKCPKCGTPYEDTSLPLCTKCGYIPDEMMMNEEDHAHLEEVTGRSYR